MPFDIRQQLFNRTTGELDEKQSTAYLDQLGKLFAESPEGQAIRNRGIDLGWATLAVDYGMRYLGVTPADMSPDDLDEVLFEIFPQKVAVEAENAPEIIEELGAFWRFLQREFGLENAAACLQLLDDNAAAELQAAMADSANFGIAKSMVMMGKARGFDTSTPEGLELWMKTYNAELFQKPDLRFPDFPALDAPKQPIKRRDKRQKIKRKMANASRKKNRKKK